LSLLKANPKLTIDKEQKVEEIKKEKIKLEETKLEETTDVKEKTEEEVRQEELREEYLQDILENGTNIPLDHTKQFQPEFLRNMAKLFQR
jgi:ATP-dependent Clp protease ATP-binding subunit ClpA